MFRFIRTKPTIQEPLGKILSPILKLIVHCRGNHKIVLALSLLALLISLSPSFASQPILVGVSLYESISKIVISSKDSYVLLQDDKTIYKFPAGSETLVTSSAQQAKLINGNQTYFANGVFYFHHETNSKDDQFFTVQLDTNSNCSKAPSEKECKQAHSYRGTIVIAPEINTLHVVNKLKMEDYLKGVVASEMPKRWPLEALKAQAVCARTYTAATLTKKPLLKPTVADQMYLGYEAEDSKTSKAVAETNGEVLMDKFGNYVDAYYSSSAGNYSSSPADVWGLSPRAYLVPVNDYADDSSFKSWTKEFSTAELALKLKDLRLAEIQSVTVFQRSVESRATKVQIKGTSLASAIDFAKPAQKFQPVNFKQESKIFASESRVKDAAGAGSSMSRTSTRFLTGEELRHKLGLPSTNFQLSYNNGKYIFKGTGFGHGIGMTQYGAKQLADQGLGYQEILGHYYRQSILNVL